LPRKQRPEKTTSKPRQRGHGPYSRRTGFRDVGKRVLIVCEGSKTEPKYFEALCRDKGLSAVRVRPCALGTNPKRIVEDAVAEMKRGDDPLDQVWCVFDRDQHDLIAEALNQAEHQAVVETHVAFSNPCFELWYLLHFECSTAYIEREAARRELRRQDRLGAYEKSMDVYDLLKGKQGDAVVHAQRLRTHHEKAGTGRPQDQNPYTDVDVLVTYLNGLAEAQGVAACPRNTKGDTR
jgi:hypothetical protein